MTAQHVPVLLERVVELIGVGVEAARETGLTPVTSFSVMLGLQKQLDLSRIGKPEKSGG